MTHGLLSGEIDPPGQWRDRRNSGSYISFQHKTKAPENEVHAVVIEQGGEYGDGKESRPVEVWAVTLPEERILMNWKDSGETIDEGVGLSEGAEIALEYMQEVNNDRS